MAMLMVIVIVMVIIIVIVLAMVVVIVIVVVMVRPVYRHFGVGEAGLVPDGPLLKFAEALAGLIDGLFDVLDVNNVGHNYIGHNSSMCLTSTTWAITI